MKPSDRIGQIAYVKQVFSDVAITDRERIEAIIQYLDEQYEEHKNDIQITQGRK